MFRGRGNILGSGLVLRLFEVREVRREEVGLPTTKLTAQKKAWMRYSRHSISSCRMGVISPTSQLHAQLVAVDRLAPLDRILRGRISGG